MSSVRRMPFWQLGWRNLWRDVRSGELGMLVLAVLLAVAALTAVAFFSDRLDRALQRDAAQLLGGDVVVSADHAIPAAFIEQADALGLRHAQTLTFPTMARVAPEQGLAARLVSLKAVDSGYPLIGQLRVSEDPAWQNDMPDHGLTQGPAAGEAWAEPALFDALGLRPGDTLMLGESAFRLSRVLTLEPDQGNSLVSFAPRVMIPMADLAATELVQPASRIRYRLPLAGPEAAVQAYVQWAELQLKQPDRRGIEVRTLDQDGGNPQLQKTLDRAGNFLNLVALLAALLSAVAVALAARAFAARHLDDCAILRVLGVRQRTMAAAYTMEFVLLGVLGSVLGLLLGYLVHLAFASLLAGLVKTTLPAAGWQPLALGLGVGLTLLLAFGLPPVLQLAGTPPLRVIRREAGQLKPASLLTVLLGVGGFALLLLASSSDRTLGLIAVAGFGVAVLLFAALGWLVLWALRRTLHSATGERLPRWLAMALRQITVRPWRAVIQISSLSLGLLSLLLLVLVRTDLVDGWQQVTPADAPNRFVINIMPEQAEAFRQTLLDGGVTQFDWYPMVRGRLVAINGQPVSPDNFTEDRARRLVDREFNLSYSAEPPTHTPIVAGQWQAGAADGISMEQGIMETLQLQLGDRLQFDMGGVLREARISSVREVDWASMHVNFFAMFPQASLGEEVAVTWITAYRNPAPVAGQASLDTRLLQTFPNITQIDMSSTIQQLQRVLAQVIRAVELLFGFGLAAGVVVLFAMVGASREERARDMAIMRAVGASRGLLARIQSTELIGTGALAGLLASVVALALAWLLARQVFGFAWVPIPWIVPVGMLAGAALAWAAGWWSLRGLLSRPVMATLRSVTQEG